MRIILSIIAFFLIIITSCDEIFTHSKGLQLEFDGKWQLQSMEFADGTTSEVDTIYYNFQNYLFRYQIYLKKDEIFWVDGHAQLIGDTSIVINLDGANYSKKFFLPHIGWKDSTRTYKIETIEKNRLILNYEHVKYNFHKF